MEISKMEKEIKLVKWQEFKPYNQVLYGDDIALITGYKQFSVNNFVVKCIKQPV